MGVRPVAALFVLAMVALIVGVDLTFLRHHVVERLVVNVAIVLVFFTFYRAVLRRS